MRPLDKHRRSLVLLMVPLPVIIYHIFSHSSSLFSIRVLHTLDSALILHMYTFWKFCYLSIRISRNNEAYSAMKLSSCLCLVTIYACMFLYFIIVIIIMVVHHLLKCTQPVAMVVGKASLSGTSRFENSKNQRNRENILHNKSAEKKELRNTIHHSDLAIIFNIPKFVQCLHAAWFKNTSRIKVQEKPFLSPHWMQSPWIFFGSDVFTF